MIIYQYRRQISNDKDFGFLKNLLEKGEMKFTKPSDFNDPFDCCPTQFSELPENTFRHAVGDVINKSIQSVRSTLNGVACFSLHPNSMLMWSHYGDQHRSVCVGFDTQILLDNPPKNSNREPLYNEITKVEYTKIRPSQKDPDALGKKSEEWRYEDEYRIVSSMKKGKPEWGPGIWNIPPCSIKEVIIGARVIPQIEENIVRLIKSLDRSLALKKVVLHMKKFELLIENLEDQPNVAPMSGFVLVLRPMVCLDTHLGDTIP
jgi:hypothetical protein